MLSIGVKSAGITFKWSVQHTTHVFVINMVMEPGYTIVRMFSYNACNSDHVEYCTIKKKC